MRNGPNVSWATSTSTTTRTTRSRPRADGARARRRLLAVAQPLRPAVSSSIRHRPAVRGERIPAGRLSAAGGRAPQLLPAAERARRRVQLPGADRRRDAGRTACRRACRRWSTAPAAAGHADYQRTTTEAANLFGFVDTSAVSNTDRIADVDEPPVAVHVPARALPFASVATDVTPYFANRMNVSGDAGITGNNQEPVNWGPPALVVLERPRAAGHGQLRAERHQDARRHAGDLPEPRPAQLHVRRRPAPRRVDVLSQQDPRGGVQLHRRATGSDFADFLLGLPQTSAIAFGNADKYLRAAARRGVRQRRLAVSAVADDEPRRALGIRGADHRGARRLVNLDVAPASRRSARSSRAIRRARSPGRRYPSSLLCARHARHSAAPRRRVAAGRRIVAGDSRRLRHLSQHERLSVDRDAAGAAAAAVEDVQRREQRRARR